MDFIKKLHTIGKDAFKLSFGTYSKTKADSPINYYYSKKDLPYYAQTIKVGKALTSHNLESVEIVE
ncbi:hypothetical protein CUS96_10150 [Enterococcus faecium]|uniref:hypothetical protein n=1 Tax=Enterococcus faecium TaxID=1352 RepID=UPI000CF2A8D7|nr:hypothetical protein [Enterococcus faecium]PQF14361.1 hypothetical protein CUS96_10150 [Enterococcus faecium]